MFDFCNQDLQVDNGDQQMNAWRDKLLFGTCVEEIFRQMNLPKTAFDALHKYIAFK